jgi:hypothetical protein
MKATIALSMIQCNLQLRNLWKTNGVIKFPISEPSITTALAGRKSSHSFFEDPFDELNK